jgi:hypothetical protein
MRTRRILGYLGIVGLVTLGLGAGQDRIAPPSRAPAPQAVALANPLDEPLRLIAEARESYRGITDYTCLFVKRERLRNQMQPENLVSMKVRTQPFSVYLGWMKPKTMAGQEACYVTGRNDGMMRVHSTGLLGVAGFVSLDPRDPRALENSRHTITEAGIGNLIDRFSRGWDNESRMNKTQVRIAEYEYNKRRCTRVEMTHPEKDGKTILFYRSILYFDKENHLPIRVENYDWPKPGGDPNGTLVESYSFADLKLNVGLSDATFEH